MHRPLLATLLLVLIVSVVMAGGWSIQSVQKSFPKLEPEEWPEQWLIHKDWATGVKARTAAGIVEPGREELEGVKKRQLRAADANCTITIAGTVSLTPEGNNVWSTFSKELVDGYTYVKHR